MWNEGGYQKQDIVRGKSLIEKLKISRRANNNNTNEQNNRKKFNFCVNSQKPLMGAPVGPLGWGLDHCSWVHLDIILILKTSQDSKVGVQPDLTESRSSSSTDFIPQVWCQFSPISTCSVCDMPWYHSRKIISVHLAKLVFEVHISTKNNSKTNYRNLCNFKARIDRVRLKLYINFK